MDASPSTSFSTLVRQERIRRNWRQQDLADHLGTTAITIKRWERGSQQPSAYFRVKLCALFGKSAEELGLQIEESPPQDKNAPTETSTPVESHTPSFSSGSSDHFDANTPLRENASGLREATTTYQSSLRSGRALVREHQDRTRMLRRLRHAYRDLLDHSLQGITWVELGLANQPDAVHNERHLLVRFPHQEEQILPPGTSILQVYQEAQEDLLILGAPGSGKSALLLDLALHLVECADTNETEPLPMILPLSSWAVQRLPLAEWLIEQLARTYDLPQKLSTRWVEQENIIPLLDGLDEMEETARSACIAAINAYHHEHLIPLVVCSRQNEYEAAAIQQRLMLQNAVVVQPLTDEHVETSLRMAGSDLSGVRAALNQQPILRELATTPLMLSVLLLTYRGASSENVATQETRLEQQVWADYVARMARQKGNENRYPLGQTRHWLTYLAQQMRVHQQTIFYAEYLHADWLTSKQQRTLAWLTIRVPGFVLGVLAGILVSLFLLSPSTSVSLLQMGLLGGFVGGCLSWNVSMGTTSTGNQLSASKRGDLMSRILLGVLVAASVGLYLGPQYSIGDWIRDGSILGFGTGLSTWVFSALLRRVPNAGSRDLMCKRERSSSSLSIGTRVPIAQQVSIPCTSPSLRWRVFAWFNRIAPQRIWQIALVLGTGMGLSFGLRYGLGVGLSDGLNNGLSLGPIYGLIYGLSVTLMVVLVSIILNVSLGTLRFAERIHWVWQSLLRFDHLRTTVIITSMVFLLFGLSNGLSVGLNFGLSVGLSNGLSVGLSNGLSNGLSYGLSVGLSIGLSYWLLLGLYQGVLQEHIEDQDRHQFNQGIHRSLRNGILMGLVSAMIIAGIGVLSVALSVALFNWLSVALFNWLNVALRLGQSVQPNLGLGNGLSYELNIVWLLVISGFLVMWAMSGGLTILRHYLIRWLLARSHRFPWCAQAFLDDATARILLQRVGGGYRFMHRRLLDYFADLDGTILSQESTVVQANVIDDKESTDGNNREG